MPAAVEELHREWKGRGLAVLAVNIREPRDKVASWVRDSGLAVPVLLDASGAVSRAYGITATPTVFVVGRDGRLLGRARGQRAWAGPAGQRLAALLTGS